MQKKSIDQIVHTKVILGYLGIVLHVPGAMAFSSLIVSLIFEEFFSIIPFLATAAISFVLGQLLYRFFYQPKTCHLWDAMIIAALAWVFIPLIGTIPYVWIASIAPIKGSFAEMVAGMAAVPNALFESFSAFTSTGLSVVSHPEEFPKSFLWWRSFSCWIGGTGLIVFVLSITQPESGQFRLYYSETRNESIGNTIQETSKIIALIYTGYTLLGIVAYFIAGMPLWEAINHSMTSVSTGGFSIVSGSFSGYNVGIKLIGIVLMLIGAISFAIHYRILKEKRLSLFFSDPQQMVFVVILSIGSILSFFIQYFEHQHFPVVDLIFNFVSALTTCGFSAFPIISYLPSLKLILILAMLIGGCAGSTSGGIKVQRFHYLLEGVFVRMRSMTEERERFITAVNTRKREPKAERFGLPMGHQAERLYAAGILLTMWMVGLFIGWFFMLFTIPASDAIDSFFEVFSAMSNAGLAAGIMSEKASTYGKFIYIILMWIGRLEILPALILIWSILFPFRCGTKEKNEVSR